MKLLTQYFYFFSFLLVLFNGHSAVAAESIPVSLKGDFIQGGLVLGKTRPGSKIYFDNQSINLSPRGEFIIGFNRDEPDTVPLKIKLPDGTVDSRKLKVAKREYKIQRIDGLPASKVTPRKPEVLQRIRREGAAAAAARTRDDDRLDFMQNFIWPVTGPISGVYGSQRVLNGKPRRPHFGVDIAAPVGTQVLAPASGLITLANPDMFFSGGTLILDHGHGLSSTFLHLNKILVKEGTFVKQGDLIAEVGKTGRVTGAHLDWRMNLFKRRVDPQLLVPEM
jgi:murein DD-endopeptidase MepM/ murein hydrolase activator NlpD